ncbi:hypothetical protein ACMHYB_45420 [Sorangium sp. So ce1128]
MVSFEFPPSQPVTRMPSFMSASSAAWPFVPSFQATFDMLPEVGAASGET